MQGIDHAIEEEEQQQQDARARERIQRIQERRARTVGEHRLVMAHVAKLYNSARVDEWVRQADGDGEFEWERNLQAAIMAKVVPTLPPRKMADMNVALSMIHDCSIKVPGYKPGEWDWTLAQLLNAPDCVVNALYSVFLSVAGPSVGDVDVDLRDSDDDEFDDSEPEDSEEGEEEEEEEEEEEGNSEPAPPVVEPEAPVADAQPVLQGLREQNSARVAEAAAAALPVAQVPPESLHDAGLEAALSAGEAGEERQKRRKEAESSMELVEKLHEDGHINEWQRTIFLNTTMHAHHDRVVRVRVNARPQPAPRYLDSERAPELIRRGVMMAHEQYVMRNHEIGKSLKDMAEWGQWVAACAHQETREMSAQLMSCIDKLEQQWTVRKMSDGGHVLVGPDLARFKTKLEGKKRKAEEHLDQYRKRCHREPTDMPKSRVMPGHSVILGRHRDYVREWAEEDRRNNLDTSLE